MQNTPARQIAKRNCAADSQPYLLCVKLFEDNWVNVNLSAFM